MGGLPDTTNRYDQVDAALLEIKRKGKRCPLLSCTLSTYRDNPLLKLKVMSNVLFINAISLISQHVIFRVILAIMRLSALIAFTTNALLAQRFIGKETSIPRNQCITSI